MNEQRQLSSPRERVRLGKLLGNGSRRFLAFLICSAVLVAAFAVSSVWLHRSGLDPNDWGSFWKGNDDDPSADPSQTTDPPASGEETDPSPEPVDVPEGAVPVISMDLSCAAYGENYIQNETVYLPDIPALRASAGGEAQSFDPEDGPVVLILHTHASEAYLPAGTGYIEGAVGDYAYSEDPSRTVVAVGEVLCSILNQNGVPAIHCTELHGENGSLRNSYRYAAECIETYRERYPSIRYVIDLHRDGILTSDGEYVRTLASGTEQPTAQIMAVVGSDGNGTEHPDWESNLSLALALRDALNRENETICRPVSLRNASYNQELAPSALLLEIGSGANTVDEAIRAVELAGRELAALITNR